MLDGNTIRKHVIEISHNAGVGHIGSALSIVDIVAALYAALFESGYISEDSLNSYAMEGDLEVHPSYTTPGVDFATGSLGMDLSYGVGAALGAKQDDSTRKAYVLISDAELNEGLGDTNVPAVRD